MEKLVNSCEKCPFYQFLNIENVDDVGICLLEKHLMCNDENLQYIEDSLNSPTWCPLKENEYTFKFDFDNNETYYSNDDDIPEEVNGDSNFDEDEIKSNSSENKVLSDLMSELENSINNNSYTKNNTELTDLISKLGVLVNEEDLSSYDDNFQSEFNNEIELIKNQLESLDSVSSKLETAFKNIDINVNHNKK